MELFHLADRPPDSTPCQKPMRTLQNIEIDEILPEHPIAVLSAIYESLNDPVQPQLLPKLEAFLAQFPGDAIEYSMILVPVIAEPYMDFRVLRRGNKIPGVELSNMRANQLYTDHIVNKFAFERVLDLASCLALKRCRFTTALSPRKSALDVKVFRAAFPVWLSDRQLHGVVLVVAPPYAVTIQNPAVQTNHVT